MKTFSEAAGTVLFFCFMLALIFLFQGEPNVWSVLHAKVMGTCK